VAYTSVPDGASTLALMGAAVATLGLAARRRKQ
jgi:MYXO-CTERM domain-containing protein